MISRTTIAQIAGMIIFLSHSTVFAAEDQALNKLIQEAKSLHAKAVSEQGGWTSTKKLISNAELSATRGKTKEAMALAKKARKEAELSYSQALNQKKGWEEPPYLMQKK